MIIETVTTVVTREVPDEQMVETPSFENFSSAAPQTLPQIPANANIALLGFQLAMAVIPVLIADLKANKTLPEIVQDAITAALAVLAKP